MCFNIYIPSALFIIILLLAIYKIAVCNLLNRRLRFIKSPAIFPDSVTVPLGCKNVHLTVTSIRKIA